MGGLHFFSYNGSHRHTVYNRPVLWRGTRGRRGSIRKRCWLKMGLLKANVMGCKGLSATDPRLLPHSFVSQQMSIISSAFQHQKVRKRQQ